MKAPRDTPASDASVPIRVNDRRRFTPEGAARAEAVEAVEGAHGMELLEAELAAAHQRINDLAQALVQAQADREAFKGRLTRERDQLLDLERGNVASAVLEAVEELDRCLLNSAPDSPLAQGVRLIRDGLITRVAATGIERLELLGQAFDPAVAEAADVQLTTDERQDGQVLEMFRPAWVLKGRVIRPGQVRVARYVAAAQA